MSRAELARTVAKIVGGTFAGAAAAYVLALVHILPS